MAKYIVISKKRDRNSSDESELKLSEQFDSISEAALCAMETKGFIVQVVEFDIKLKSGQ